MINNSIDKYKAKKLEKQSLNVTISPNPSTGFDIEGQQADVLFPMVLPPDRTTKQASLDGCRTNSLAIKAVENGFLYEWTETDRRGNPITSDISNFVILPLYLLKHNKNAKRIFEILNIYGERATLCIPIKNMVSVDSFKAEIEGKGNFVPKWNKTQFDALKEAIFFQEDQAEEIETLGWQPVHGLFAFANGIFDGDSFYQVDEFGIAHTPKGKFYIPAFSNVNEHGAAEYANERKFKYEAGNLQLVEWCELLQKAYGDNGKIGFCFALACLFRDIIFNSIECFPILFLFAPPQSGKSTFRDSFLCLFGEPQIPISLESASSPKGFSRKLAQYFNALIVFEEYKNKINGNLIGMLKSVYDGIGYERAQATNDNKTHTTPVLSGCMLVGQEVPTKENALFTRVLMLEFGKQNWSAEEKNVLDRLKSEEGNGLGTVLLQMLQHRKHIELHFKKAFDNVFQEIRSIASCKDASDRHIKNAAAILAPFRLIAEKVDLPFNYEEVLNIVAERLHIQTEMMTRANELNQFWDAFHYLRNDQRLWEDKHFKYGEEKGKKLLYLVLAQIHPIYVEYMSKQGMTALDKETLLSYLKQQSYFILPRQLDPNIKQKTDCKSVNWSIYRGRAYLFLAESYPILNED